MNGARSRRGTVYLMVLSTVTVASAIVLCAAMAGRSNLRAATAGVDSGRARDAALAAIELGRLTLADPAWRTKIPSKSAWINGLKLGSATLDLAAVDPVDNNPASGAWDPIDLTGTGRSGVAREMLSVRFAPSSLPMACLSSGLVTADIITFSSAAVSSALPIRSAKTISATSSLVDAPVIAQSTISGGTYVGTQQPGVAAPALPAAAFASEYTDAGVWIDANLLSAGTTMSGKCLGPGYNPYGTTHARGIYVLDCRGRNIIIRNSRIVGTLVLWNPGAGTVIEGSMAIEPAAVGFPALLALGTVTIRLDATPLSEAGLGVNFNPPGVPAGGVTDSDMLDEYASMIRGIVFASGGLTLAGANSFVGPVVARGAVSISGAQRFAEDPGQAAAPPPGFRDPGPMVEQRTTWQRLAD